MKVCEMRYLFLPFYFSDLSAKNTNQKQKKKNHSMRPKEREALQKGQ